MFRFSTRSDFDKLQRMIQAKKFYATLPHKLDKAEEEWHKAQPDEPELDWTFEETGEFGQDGWTISYSHKAVERTDD